MEAIVLCGGFGTRLGTITRNTPKPLLQVAGRPFLAHVLDKLCVPEVNGFILATGFKAEQVSAVIQSEWQGRPVKYSVEMHPLGTGGAIRLAMENFSLDQAVVVNGDTFFDCDLSSMIDRFEEGPWATRMALRAVDDCKRFGRVQISSNGRVVGFGEKEYEGPGLINAGVYIQRRTPLEQYGSRPFSFEADYLARLDPAWPIQGFVKDGYFVDMGIPEDLERARRELAFR
jgi:D-glycero-alpha-D-manno-heptose 1-phosphate guanylyltransferase